MREEPSSVWRTIPVIHGISRWLVCLISETAKGEETRHEITSSQKRWCYMTFNFLIQSSSPFLLIVVSDLVQWQVDNKILDSDSLLLILLRFTRWCTRVIIIWEGTHSFVQNYSIYLITLFTLTFQDSWSSIVMYVCFFRLCLICLTNGHRRRWSWSLSRWRRTWS